MNDSAPVLVLLEVCPAKVECAGRGDAASEGETAIVRDADEYHH